jgi:hypothetical protein
MPKLQFGIGWYAARYAGRAENLTIKEFQNEHSDRDN